MRKFFTALVLIPLGVIFLAFAIANRRLVTVSFDPFNATDPSVGLTLPLFMVIIVVAILGVLAGSFATWLRQRHWRRAARQNEAEARDARAQLAQLQAAMQPQRTPSSPVLLPDLSGTGLGTRDKHDATL
ncbi:MAG: LapA family protein [Rhizobiales bacterium]|nr:LapA family protein [Hyphomicrobiales bacterium]